MPLYLRKRIKIMPGLSLNLSKSGLGMSAGPRGFKISHGPRGTQINAGRGGLYYRKTLNTRRQRASSPAPSVPPLVWVCCGVFILVVTIFVLSAI